MKTKEELEKIKQQVISQIQSSYSEQEASKLIDKINSMNQDAFINFLKLQGIIQDGDSSQCIFCQIIKGSIPKTELKSNSKSQAILEINPISKGHALIIPNEHITKEESIPKEAFELAKEISENIQNAFNPIRVDQIITNVMGHFIINLLPVYSSETINSQRNSADPNTLNQIKDQILNSKPQIIEEEKPQIIEEEKQAETIEKENLWIPKKHIP